MVKIKKIKIGDLGKIITGNTPPTNNRKNYGGKYPFIKPTDMVIDQRHVYDYEDTYSEISYQRYKKSFIPKGATGVVTIGTVGEKIFQAHEDCFTNQSVNSVIVDENIFDKDYIFYLLKYNLPKVEGANPGTASGRHHVSKSNFSSIQVDVVEDLKTQKKTAKILANYDELIENNLKQIKLLEEKARFTYEEWFLRFRVDGVALEIDGESGLPFGWERVKITSFVNINQKSISKKTAPKEIRYIDIASTETGYYKAPEKISFEEAPSRARRVLRCGDTIFSTVRPNRKTYSLILEESSNLIASTGFAVLTPIEYDLYPFIYLSVSNQKFIDSVVAVAGGVAYPAINQKDFEKLEIVIASKDILENFSKKCKPLLELKHRLLMQNQNLKVARDILLPRLMMGVIS